MKTVKEYINSLPHHEREKVIAAMFSDSLGSANDIGACSGCTQETPNGSCQSIDGVCKWVPEIG